MNYALVENNQVTKVGLPQTGYLKDGSSVSGYNLLDHETLLQEGWLPIRDELPEYNHETNYLQRGGYEVKEGEVVVIYEVVEILEQLESEPQAPDPLEIEVAELWYSAMILEDKASATESELAMLWYEIMMGGM